MRKQCKHCPWKVNTDPREIPNGYDPMAHAALASTIAVPGFFSPSSPLRVMACHETNVRGKELPCVGWMVNQLGEGNNIALRLAVHRGQFDADVETVGSQHTCLEDTLP